MKKRYNVSLSPVLHDWGVQQAKAESTNFSGYLEMLLNDAKLAAAVSDEDAAGNVRQLQRLLRSKLRGVGRQ